MLLENNTNVLERDDPLVPPTGSAFGVPGRPAAKRLPDLILAHAKHSPDRLALVMGCEKMSYAELELRASRLAAYLQSRGAKPGVLVGLCLERSPRFVVGALAIMKCGAAYLPMDPAHPVERLRFIMKDAGAGLLVTEGNLPDRFHDSGISIVNLDAKPRVPEPSSIAATEVEQNADSLAYVIYTSGSAGRPKGVEVTHRNLANLICWHLKAFGVDSSTRATFQAGVGFDAAVWEIWPYLAIGAAIFLPDNSTRLSAEALRDWLISNQITITFVPTAIAEQMIGRPWPAETALRFLLTGADTLHRYPLPGLPFSFVNNYGPTECTVVATSGTVGPEKSGDGLPSIGLPIGNVRIHILDEQQREVPEGTAGEIYIGGAGVARGYRNRPDLTAERFMADHFSGDGGRLYRTGDLGRFLPNGEVAFLGRIDDQVKIRGYRVELNEINAVLNEHPSVRASIVIAREDSPGEKRLVGYVVSRDSQRDEESLRQFVRRRLPDYMEPGALVWMESLPLTANGKVDRAALPAPKFDEGGRERGFIAPRTPVEETLTGIIREVLKIPRVSVDDDFFQLGAHSLLGAQIIARVRDVFGIELKLLDVFDAPNVAELSVRIEKTLTHQLNAMTEAEVEAALAALEEPVAGSNHSQ
jgi:amino acid adenylation domain-containing protein